MTIKITVGVICKNEEKHIYNLLSSLINQNFKKSNYEIIVVDGNSSDRTREIATQVLKKSNIKHKILNERDFGFYGPCFARNLVIDNSNKNAKYIAFIDADCVASKNWLSALFKKIDNTPDIIAGAGGPRLVAKTKSKKELLINAILTSYLSSGGNPAFSKRKIKYISSIPNYNAIYKKSVLQKFRYDQRLIVSDDNEINYRIKKAGYKFLYEPDAKVYHHETDSFLQFIRNMFSYGANIANTVRKHKAIIRPAVPLTLGLIFYFVLLMFFNTFLYRGFGGFIFIPGFLYILFLIAVFIEVFLKTRSIYSFFTFILIPIQHLCYGFGIIYNFLFHRTILKC